MSATVSKTTLFDYITRFEALPAQRATPGQLWQRVAEAVPNVLAPEYSARLLVATVNAYIRVGRRAGTIHDRAVRREYTFPGFRQIVDPYASGIIRAGVNVK